MLVPDALCWYAPPYHRNISRSSVELSPRQSSQVQQSSIEYLTPVTAPVIGTKKIAVVLVNFSNAQLSSADKIDIYNNFEYLKGYFREASYGKLTFDITYIYNGGTTQQLTGNETPVTLTKWRSYYTDFNSLVGMTNYVLNQTGNSVSTLSYDMLVFVCASVGQESSGNYSDIWSEVVKLDAPMNGFTYVSVLAASEAYGASPIGVYCNNIAFQLGIPASYNVRTGESFVGKRDVMDRGGRNNDGKTPAPLSPWAKQYLGWLEPVVISHPQEITSMQPVELSSSTVLRVPVLSRDDEYFLVCFSSCSPYNPSPVGTGIMIWHVNERDFDNTTFMYRIVHEEFNTHQYPSLELIVADNTKVSSWAQGDATDLWPGQKGIFASPDSDSYDGQKTMIRISDIANDGVTAHLSVYVWSDGAASSSSDAAMRVFGSKEGRGTINPDRGDAAIIVFKGAAAGTYECHVVNTEGEELFRDTREGVTGGCFEWMPHDVASGVYIVRIKGPDFSMMKKIIVVR
jgi:M6 family metalloprotease-like protein